VTVPEKKHERRHMRERRRAWSPSDLVHTLTNELQTTTKELKSHAETIRFMAQTVHQAHHHSPVMGKGTWEHCPMNTCTAAQQALKVGRNK
jgi:hypothetical protein